jgi:hypothetical protein
MTWLEGGSWGENSSFVGEARILGVVFLFSIFLWKFKKNY